jgi:integrase
LLERLELVLKGVHGLTESEAQQEIRRLVYKSGPVLPLTTKEWERLDREDKKLDDLRFHDLRHEATSRLAEKLQMHELMKVTGHKTSAMLSRYYHPRAEALALKLD